MVQRTGTEQKSASKFSWMGGTDGRACRDERKDCRSYSDVREQVSRGHLSECHRRRETTQTETTCQRVGGILKVAGGAVVLSTRRKRTVSVLPAIRLGSPRGFWFTHGLPRWLPGRGFTDALSSDGLFEAADRLAASDFPATTMAEMQVEVNAVRSQRRQPASGT